MEFNKLEKYVESFPKPKHYYTPNLENYYEGYRG